MTEITKDQKENQEFWRNKLLAFLHDPPNKCLNIYKHEEIAKRFVNSVMPEETEKWEKDADHTASSIDRLPFPQRVCTADFAKEMDDEKGSTFIHPFCGSKLPDLQNLDKKDAAYEEILNDALGSIDASESFQQRHFRLWRFWLENTLSTGNNTSRDLAFFPADTRIPDHTIWNHLSVTSALEGTKENGKLNPAFLMFKVGPVQDFIAAARSTRDLWSGSYMLSWLIGHAIKAISDEIGPDSFIFPALQGSGVFDAANKEMYQKIKFTGKNGKQESLWDRLYKSGDSEIQKEGAAKLLTPNLPNRFFAVVPASRAKELAEKAEKAFRAELKNISESCWQKFVELAKDAGENPNADWKKRWDKQIEFLPEFSWISCPVEQDVEKILEKAEKIPNGDEVVKTIRQIIEVFERTIPKDERDERYYSDKIKKEQLGNWGITWAANYAFADYLLASRRNIRNFSQFVTDENQEGAVKDYLTGKEESIGSEKLWDSDEVNKSEYFKDNKGSYGAISIIKRIWCRGEECYLLEKLGIRKSVFQEVISSDSVEDISKKNKNPESPYVAIIALDGDEMGKWMSGEKSENIKTLLAGKARGYMEKHLSQEIKRPLTASYHLQFSEALSNFSNYVAEKIVTSFKGQLIYAGGDDVLAMLPADRALECVQILRACFRGDEKALFNGTVNNNDFSFPADGFLNIGKNRTLLMPGTKADVSVGIAIAHNKYPLQRMVKEAQRAEKRAKNEYNRGAFAISLLKRGGETIHYGNKFTKEVHELYSYFIENTENQKISNRFPYALAGLLAPYKLDENEICEGLNIFELIKHELNHCCHQQIKDKNVRTEFYQKAVSYLEEIKKNSGEYADFVKLFLTVAFIERDRKGDN